jgi:predicted Holliday junction resolvase-like endonuclease
MLELFFLITIFVLLIIAIYFHKKSSYFEALFKELKEKMNSQAVKYGRLSEQWIPFSMDFPFSKEDFRFIGSPIDGIVFDEDKIVFCEFKVANSRLSEKQKKIKKLVEDKKIEWFEMRLQ